MNYELAKELKDAGFPGSEYWEVTDAWPDVFTERTAGGVVSVPSLEELISACKDHAGHTDDFYLEGHGDIWTARLADGGPFERFFGKGLSANEAVAYLWLMLHKNSA